MNKHLLTAIISCFILSSDLSAQSKFNIEVNGGIREYNGDRGSAMYFRAAPDYQAVGFGFSYYLTPSFDASIYGSVGDLGYYDRDRLGFRARITDVLLGLNYKFNNGYILREDAMFKPYLRAGWGGMQSVSRILHGVPGYSQNRTWFASHWNAGLGVKIRLTPTLDLQIQELYNYSFDDNYDGLPFTVAGAKLNDAMEGNKPLHDAYLYHSIGFVYNFGGTSGGGGSKRVKDSDGDGISDRIDLCPKTPAGYEVDTSGCPLDDDMDGVINEQDSCPQVKGNPENNGCPDFSEEELATVKQSAKGIFFETGSDVIKSESFENLDKVAEIASHYPDAILVIEGHTDNQGDDASNLDLSQRRADAVKKYLTLKGVDTDRIKATGYGETQPLADNSTEEGRALNRRVDITLTY
ncbi:OmpA family protein [bacterium]|nr:OmpA family protein [bacterium]